MTVFDAQVLRWKARRRLHTCVTLVVYNHTLRKRVCQTNCSQSSSPCSKPVPKPKTSSSKSSSASMAPSSHARCAISVIVSSAVCVGGLAFLPSSPLSSRSMHTADPAKARLHAFAFLKVACWVSCSRSLFTCASVLCLLAISCVTDWAGFGLSPKRAARIWSLSFSFCLSSFLSFSRFCMIAATHSCSLRTSSRKL